MFSKETWSKCHILTSIFDNYHFQLIKITNIISDFGQLKQVWVTENENIVAQIFIILPPYFLDKF